MDSNHPSTPPSPEQFRRLFGRTALELPAGGLQPAKKTTTTTGATAVVRTATPAQHAGPAEHQSVKARLHQQLLDEINARDLLGVDEERLTAEIQTFVERVLSDTDLVLNDRERRQLADDLLEEALGVGPLAPLMADPA